MAISSIGEVTLVVIYSATTPCFFIHVGIIFSIFCLGKYNKPRNYWMANLSMGTILNQISLGIMVLERHFSLGPISRWCGPRAILYRYSLAIITFTITEMVLERGYISRNPISRPYTRGRYFSPGISVLLINSLSFVILIPISFSRQFDPEIPGAVKCIKIFLLHNVALDYVYRVFLLFTLHVGPALILFHEWTKIRRLIHTLDPSGSEARVEHGILTRHRLRLMKNSSYFICVFVIFSIPYGILDAFDASNVKLSASIQFYRDRAREWVVMICYTFLTVSTVIIVYFNRIK